MDMMTVLVATVVTSVLAGTIQAIAAYWRLLALRRGSDTSALGNRGAQEELRGEIVQFWSIAKVWCWFTGVVAGGSLVLSPILGGVGGLLGYVMLVIIIPVVTLFVAFHWPIPWGLAASAVAVLHGAGQLALRLGGGSPAQEDASTLVDAYVANAILVSLVAFFRSRRAYGA